MRAPTPPSAETDAAMEAAVTFLRACGANGWFNLPADVSFFRPKHKRAKLDAMYEKNFAKLFAMARKGDVEADYYLRLKLPEEAGLLAPAQQEALRFLLLRPAPKRRRGPGRKKVVDRNFIIAQAVLRVTSVTGFDATRNPASTAPSGCSVVAEALRRSGLAQLTESAVNTIWGKYNLREEAEGMKTVLVLPKVAPS